MNLAKYMKENMDYEKDHHLYNESFCNITMDYLSSYEKFSIEDVKFLKENGYEESMFIEDGEKTIDVTPTELDVIISALEMFMDEEESPQRTFVGELLDKMVKEYNN